MTGLPTGRMRRRRSALADTRGTALIEFGFVLPLLVALFLGGFRLCDGIACLRQLTITTRALADLTSQYRIVTNADVTEIMDASVQIMAPYDADQAAMRLTMITIVDPLRVQVRWSKARKMAPYPQGVFPATAADGVPVELRIPGASYIVSQMDYTYNPRLGSLVDPLPFSRRVFMVPRKSTTVDLISG